MCSRHCFRTLTIVFTSAVMTFASSQATKADYLYNYVGLTCDEAANSALIRFGALGSDGVARFPLDAEPSHRDLAMRPIQPSRACTWSNGWEVKIKHGEDRVFPFGRCGAAPPQWISLWMNHRKILSREVFVGDCHGSFRLHSIRIDESSFVKCRFAERTDPWDWDSTSEVEPVLICESGDLDIQGIPIDELEYPPVGAAASKVGTIVLPIARDEMLCRLFIASGDEAYRAPPDIVGRLDPDGTGNFYRHDQTISFRDLAEPQPIFDRSVRGNLGFIVGKANFDFDNDGRADIVYRISGETRPFWGSYYIVARIEDAETVAAFVRAIDSATPSQLEDKAERLGLRVYHGGQSIYGDRDPDGRQTFLDAVRVRASTYVLAYRYFQTEPTAVLVKPTPAGDLHTVCQFQFVDDNF